MKRLLITFSLMAIVLAATMGAFAAEITISGKIQKTVEPGGWVIDGKSKYLLLNAGKFQSQSWFKEGTNVEAIGETKDVMTTYMEGTPFEARSVRPLEQAETRRVTRVMVSGDSIVQAQPDTAILNISVVTQAKQAL